MRDRSNYLANVNSFVPLFSLLTDTKLTRCLCRRWGGYGPAAQRLEGLRVITPHQETRNQRRRIQGSVDVADPLGRLARTLVS